MRNIASWEPCNFVSSNRGGTAGNRSSEGRSQLLNCSPSLDIMDLSISHFFLSHPGTSTYLNHGSYFPYQLSSGIMQCASLSFAAARYRGLCNLNELMRLFRWSWSSYREMAVNFGVTKLFNQCSEVLFLLRRLVLHFQSLIVYSVISFRSGSRERARIESLLLRDFN
uniref:Uncharacterized protein n=1 Tax=Panagrellus redivivus TaxID=6233 RepID=A0A7E4W426_PANRE